MKDISELLNFGIINFDKPAGPTSYSISEFVRRQLKVSKTSHMGTLDPKVSGVLPITLGRACKLAGYFIRHDKSYVGVLETHKDCDIKELQKLIDENFVGKILQTPPHRAAVKQEEREREVYFWKLLEASEDGRYFLFEAKVEGGTYIRKLCSDLGEMIEGAHMGELRRTEAGIFSEGVETGDLGFGRLVRLDEFEDAVQKAKLSKDAGGRWQVAGDDSDLRGMIMDATEAIRKVLPSVEVDKSALKSLYIGRPLLTSNVLDKPELKEGDFFALFCEEKFIGVYRKTGEENVFGRSEFVCN
jgi:predicted rRNA pseudouridine synthase